MNDHFTPTDADLEAIDNAADRAALVQVPNPDNPMALVRAAIDRGMDPNAILDFIERVKRTEAAEKYAAALARFQAECPQILKTRNVPFKGGQGSMYKFASYDDIDKVIAPLLRACEIVVSFTVPKMENNVLFGTCRVRVGTHFEDTSLPIPVSPGQNTNKAQDFGSTLTFLKRYLICAALNIRITDNLEADTDGTTSSDFITQDQLAELRRSIARVEKTMGRDIPNERMQQFFGWLSIESLDKLPVSSFQKALDEVRRWQKKAEGAKEKKS